MTDEEKLRSVAAELLRLALALIEIEKLSRNAPDGSALDECNKAAMTALEGK